VIGVLVGLERVDGLAANQRVRSIGYGVTFQLGRECSAEDPWSGRQAHKTRLGTFLKPGGGGEKLAPVEPVRVKGWDGAAALLEKCDEDRLKSGNGVVFG